MEDFYIGGASVKLFLPIFKMNFPKIVDIALPAEGVFHNLVFVSIRKTYPMQGYKIMHGLWGTGQMMFTKYIIVVEDDVDVHNTSEVLFRLCANTDPQRDSIFTKGPSEVLDHATSEIAIGSKLGIDATKKIAGEGFKPLAAADSHGRKCAKENRRLARRKTVKLPSTRNRRPTSAPIPVRGNSARAGRRDS
jgi:4-hydroxy-3-polyprenylbenzoate decarboxylase